MLKKKGVLFVLAGPTAVGKTKLSFEIAKFINSPIISADSRQFYKELSIGTAKPTNKELDRIKHLFINSKSIVEYYSAGDFEKDVLNFLDNYYKKNNNALMIGGSGMYIDAVCNGFDDLPNDLLIREELNTKFKLNGINFLQDKLKVLDPDHFKNIDLNNPQRLIRAIEVCLITNGTYSSLLNGNKKKRPFRVIKILLNMDRKDLNLIIENRVDQMINQGLFNEVKELIKYKSYNALNTVGYKEIFKYYDGLYSKNEAIDKIKTNTKKYAKRQLTWFKKDKDYIEVDNKNYDKSLSIIKDIILKSKD